MARRKSKSLRSTSGKIIHKITEVDGIKFDSKMESKYYLKLKEDKANGLIKDFELQPVFVLQEKFIKVDGKIIKGSDEDFNKMKRTTKAPTTAAISYKSDFLIINNDDTKRLVDTKGMSTADFEIKRKLFTFLYPDLDLEVIILDEKKNKWVDFYEYRKEERARIKAKKLAKAEKEKLSELAK